MKDNAISSDRTPHSARLVNGSLYYWEVSYLPGRRMDYYDAHTAMTIADMAGPEHTHDELRAWVRREIWADRIGLNAVDVLDHVACPPAWAAGEKGAYEHDREYFPRQPRRKPSEPAERDEPEAGG
jgi:hypothetical protein